MTVRDIAAIIHQDGELFSAAVERVRYWTDLGVLKAKGSKRPGTGHKRRYSADAAITAGILQTLIAATGSPAIALREGMATMLAQLRELAKLEEFSSTLIVIGKHPSGVVANK